MACCGSERALLPLTKQGNTLGCVMGVEHLSFHFSGHVNSLEQTHCQCAACNENKHGDKNIDIIPATTDETDTVRCRSNVLA